MTDRTSEQNGTNDHRDDRRADLAEEFFQIHQRERGQHGRDNLCLIADHVDGEEAEIPLGDICRCCGCDSVGVQQLAGNKRQAEDDAQALGHAHLLVTDQQMQTGSMWKTASPISQRKLSTPDQNWLISHSVWCRY